MESILRYVAPPSQCGYLPDRDWCLEYEMVATLTAPEYQSRLQAGWRRFGHMLFHPCCLACHACQSLRVVVNEFKPSRSQRRAFQKNAADIEVRIGLPSVNKAKLRLYDRYHDFQSEHKGWPQHPAKDVASYRDSFVFNPFPTEEWCYYLEGQLVGVGYVDALPKALSAIYFFYDPDQRHRGLGVFNVLCQLMEAQARGIPYLYLGYYVAGCPSLEYKACFQPNQVIDSEGRWVDFHNRRHSEE